MARSRFQQAIVDGALVESRDGGAPRSIERAYLARGGRLVALRDGGGAGLKWAARLVYVSPSLVLVRLLVHGVDAEKGEWVVVGFVAIVMAFFVMLAFYLVAAFVAWGQKQSAALVRPRHVTDDLGATDADAQDLGRLVTVTGRAVALDGSSAALLCDFWRQQLRMTEASVFAIARATGSPVVVRLTTAPLVIGESADEKAALVLDPESLARTEVLGEDLGETTQLLPGDAVTVTGQLLGRIPNMAEFDLDGEMHRFASPNLEDPSPYRATTVQGGLLVSDSVTAPAIITVERRSTRT